MAANGSRTGRQISLPACGDRATVAAMAMLAALYAAWPIWRALFPLEIDIDEPWNAYWADAVREGRPLYPHPGALIVNNYPPLSFYIIAALSAISFDAVYVGRALSLAAVAITGVAVAACIRQLGGARLAAAFGGFWFCATMMRCFPDYVGKNDPHLPALAVTVMALAWLLQRQARGRAAEPAILLMALAGFYKHNLIATPISAMLWLGLQDRRAGLRAFLIGASFAAAGLLLCAAVYGSNFIAQLLFSREHSVRWLPDAVAKLQWIAPALAISVVWACYDWKSKAARFTAIFIAVSLLSYCVQKLGKAIGSNAQFELVAATAVALGMAFSRASVLPMALPWGAQANRLMISAIVIARLVLTTDVEPYLILASPDYRRQFYASTLVAKSEIERIRNNPGPVYCSIMTICRQAGKPYVYDAFAIEQRLALGRLAPSEASAKIAAQGIRFEIIDRRAEAGSLARRLFSQAR